MGEVSYIKIVYLLLFVITQLIALFIVMFMGDSFENIGWLVGFRRKFG